MQVRPFQEEDLDEINGWLKFRGQKEMPIELVSRTGFIVAGIACGFLYATDSRACYFDLYISNKEIPGDKRRIALDEISVKLIETAKERGYWMIIANSSNPSVQQRCKDFGFEDRGYHKVFIMEIKNGIDSKHR